jgi:hypothetical protein
MTGDGEAVAGGEFGAEDSPLGVQDVGDYDHFDGGLA